MGHAAENHGSSGGGLDTLMTLVFEQLRALARERMAAERPGHTLQPTALVHEACLRLAKQDRAQWRSRTQFVAVASEMMRRILIDHARGHAAAVRGGDRKRLTLHDSTYLLPGREVDLIDLDEALVKLAAFDERRSKVVELRFFGGLTNEEVAEALGVSKWTVIDDWELARAWLRRELTTES